VINGIKKRHGCTKWFRRAKAPRLPNMHETLFVAHRRGPKILAGALQCSVLFMAVYIAVLIVDVVTQNGGAFTPLRWTFFVLAWLPPAINLLWLIPKVVSKFCIVTSVEYMKEAPVIDEVVRSTRRAR